MGGAILSEPKQFWHSVSVSSDGSFVFWGTARAPHQPGCRAVSVSSDGSFVFWGERLKDARYVFPPRFQYPLMDRLYFGGRQSPPVQLGSLAVSVSSDGSFVFWGDHDADLAWQTAAVSVSSDGSFVFWGVEMLHAAGTRSVGFSIL